MIGETILELEQYRAIGTVEEIKEQIAELERWHTDHVNKNIKNPFAWTSTLVCHNCDHKYDYIEELEAEIEKYHAIGTVEECRAAVEIIRYMIQEGIEPEVLEAYVQFEDELAKKGFTVKSVLEAREKQIAAKPLVGKDIEGNEYAICRECSAILSDGEWFAQYCPDCGKKVDWREKEQG